MYKNKQNSDKQFLDMYEYQQLTMNVDPECIR